VRAAITNKTKVIMPVDFAGFPVDYNALNELVRAESIQSQFQPKGENQQKLGRILILADSAHAIGATYERRRTGSLTDLAVFSFHAVKNLSTAEGGAISLNLPAPFDNEALYTSLCVKSLHGQNKDALAKTQRGNWRYDIVEAGYKCNMTDIQAAMGMVELRNYDSETLVKRKRIFELYDQFLGVHAWAELPLYANDHRTSSYHLYPLRIKGVTEQQRDEIIAAIFEQEVAVNVHFMPVPLTAFYSGLGYKASDYPVSMDNYSREISLPVYFDLSEEDVTKVAKAVKVAVAEVLNLG
jgi:dTDP-4-amino-4,6-dideoxygalactose transaminase